MTQRPNWDEYFMLQAKLAACRSTCNSRPQGAALVKNHRILSTGYNGALPGQEHCSDQKETICPQCNGYSMAKAYLGICPVCNNQGFVPYCHRRATQTPDARKDRACVSAHAEANAISQAALIGVSVRGSTLYCTTRPCAVCEKLLIQSGVIKTYYELDYDDPDYSLSIMPMERLEVSPEAMEAAIKVLQPGTSRRRLTKTK